MAGENLADVVNLADAAGLAEVESRLRRLEARLRAAEDQLEILRLLNSYGPLVDSGSAEEAADLWISGGGYEFGVPAGSAVRVEAPQGLADLYRTEPHTGLVAAGVAHLTAPPRVTVSGDTAEAVGYSFVVLREDDRWFLWRAAVNHWTLLRTPAGWRIRDRRNRVLDGSPESQAIMRLVRG
ncbi:nuclear transport factor 2 family protein [Frankia sp. Mgl5]|uniref:nuclear transport factor 2 family protein n=1 Tax=Frankia sp. Mgl5 TaxID=2933793 RepID=UPI00200DC16D|nr:nuclear transport factor 2 family protein [Frankia sp. Mgl5]MCK9929158.1 nuclear transport factor 2 family protein [Frankia sp. Mgl5]